MAESRSPGTRIGELRLAMRGLTAQGRSVIAAGLVVAAFSPLLGEKELWEIGTLLVLLPLVAAGAVSLMRSHATARRELRPAVVAANTPATVRLTVRTDRALRWLLVEDRVPVNLLTSESYTPAAEDAMGPRFAIAGTTPGEPVELEYSLYPTRRGRYTIGPLTQRRGDPFGMCTLLRPMGSATTLLVTPATTPLPPNRLIEGRVGLGEHRGYAVGTYGDDDATVRGYRRGDEPRKVHWRSTARAGELMVRQQEQPRHACATVLLDTRGGAYLGSDDRFEWSVSAAASVTAHLAGLGLRIRLLTDTGDRVETPLDDDNRPAPEKTRGIMEFLADLAPSSRHGLADGFEVTAGALDNDRDGGIVVAMVGELSPADIAWLAETRGGIGPRAELAFALMNDAPRVGGDIGGWFPGMEPHHLRSRSAAPTIAGWRCVSASPAADLATLWRALASTGQQPQFPGPR
jgi:uncharacterized protein (DUF58 family)